jgi:hypothetical protein
MVPTRARYALRLYLESSVVDPDPVDLLLIGLRNSEFHFRIQILTIYKKLYCNI